MDGDDLGSTRAPAGVTQRVIFLEEARTTTGQHTLTASEEKQALAEV